VKIVPLLFARLDRWNQYSTFLLNTPWIFSTTKGTKDQDDGQDLTKPPRRLAVGKKMFAVRDGALSIV
jgi:hypothetical protein